MAYCKFCGAQIRDGTAFCTSCGKPVGAAAHAPAQTVQQPAPPPFAQAQRTADRVFPSQQRSAAQQFNAASSSPVQAPYGTAQAYAPAQPGAGIDWEHFQPRSAPKSAGRLIWAATVVIFAVIVMVWTLLIR